MDKCVGGLYLVLITHAIISSASAGAHRHRQLAFFLLLGLTLLPFRLSISLPQALHPSLTNLAVPGVEGGSIARLHDGAELDFLFSIRQRESIGGSHKDGTILGRLRGGFWKGFLRQVYGAV